MSNSRTTPRKTVDVELVFNRVNSYLRLSPDECTEGRQAVAGVLESVLMATNNYQGFGYIKSEFDERGVYQGHDFARGHFIVTDETRRQYYRPRSI